MTEADRAWEQVTGALARHRGLVVDSTMTPLDVAANAAPQLGSAGPALDRLAELVTASRWAPDGLDAAEAAELGPLSAQVIEAASARAPAPV